MGGRLGRVRVGPLPVNAGKGKVGGGDSGGEDKEKLGSGTTGRTDAGLFA